MRPALRCLSRAPRRKEKQRPADGEEDETGFKVLEQRLASEGKARVGGAWLGRSRGRLLEWGGGSG